MAWYWQLWWGAICLYATYNIGNSIAMIGVAFVNIEKERNRRADAAKKANLKEKE